MKIKVTKIVTEEMEVNDDFFKIDGISSHGLSKYSLSDKGVSWAGTLDENVSSICDMNGDIIAEW